METCGKWLYSRELFITVCTNYWP